MKSVRLYLAFHALLGVSLLPASVRAEGSQAPAALTEMPLPGGITAALEVLKDPVPPDRAQFLVEVIRRAYAMPITVRSDPREVALRALLVHLDREQRANRPSSAVTLPLPLTPEIWTDAVFGGRVQPDTLAAAILESRNASLFYYGLLSLDGPTRVWIGSQRNLVAELAARYAPAFAVAAPGFRVAGDRVRVPGGQPAESAWEAIVGRRLNEPAEFLHALLSANDGRLGYFLTALAELSPEQIAFALGPDPAAGALRRLSIVFERATPGWRVNERTLWRPRRDPALLLSDLATDDRGKPILPGSRAFWTAVFSSDDFRRRRGRDAELAQDATDFAWLCEEVFASPPAEQRRRYEAVLFASRILRHVTPETAPDAVEAVRSASAQPALAAILERARVGNVAVYAAAARRAERFSSISPYEARIRTLSQFQGTLALLVRMVSRGSITPDALSDAVSSLSQLEWNAEGDYEGAVVRWFGGWVATKKPDTPLDDALIELLAGVSPASARYVEWEGTRYKLDLAAAERARLERLLGEGPQRYLSAAEALVRLDPTKRRRLAADDAWGRGVVDLTYAIAIGQPEHAAETIGDLARRHDFGMRPETARSGGPWILPVVDVSTRGMRISGALLGLETALAEYSLTRVSTRPPRKPTLSSEERGVFVATVPLTEPALLLDDDQAAMVKAIHSARERVAAIRTGDDAERLAQSIPLGPIRRTLLPWVVAHDPARTAAFLSPVELLWLGLGNSAAPSSMNGWGVLGYARTGCLCLQVIERRPLDVLTGRVNAGMLASGFPDLGLRLAELLADLKMPAALLGGVLAPATFDFVNGAGSRDEDDRRGLVEFVLALRIDRVEEYLAMLTTGGPLVPPRGDANRLEGVAQAGRRR